MLSRLYARAPGECSVEIVFRPNRDGLQENECRDDLEAFARKPSVSTGRVIAERLQRVTTHRSGLGLLFLLMGSDSSGRHTLVIARFPADQGVVAEEHAKQLTVEFIERVFMKNTKAYKSAIYSTESLAAGFSDGRAVDRQLSGPLDLSEYWIGEFLESEFRTTGPAGTRRLALALRDAVKRLADSQVKQELISAAGLIRGQHGSVRSTSEILRRLGLSEQASAAIERAFPRPELLSDSFRFDASEFSKHVLYRSVELDNGAVLMADDSDFDSIFHTERSVGEGRVRYATEGAIVDQRLRKTK